MVSLEESIIANQRKHSKAKQAKLQNEDAAMFALHREMVEKLGDSLGYETSKCPYCYGLIWTKNVVVEPNLNDKVLRRWYPSWRESGQLYEGESPDMFRDFCERVQELGKKEGLRTFRCPNCGFLLWSKTEIFLASLRAAPPESNEGK